MPLYSYRCDNCRKVFEVLQKGTQGRTPCCPDCGGVEVVRLPALPASPIVRNKSRSGCCGERDGCESPKRCCERQQ